MCETYPKRFWLGGNLPPSQFAFSVLMNNYEKTRDDACRRFTAYDMAALSSRPGVEDAGQELKTSFLGETVRVCKKNGAVCLDGRKADFGEVLSVLDWLCDGRRDAAAAGEYCTVSSLPGVLVSGSGLVMSADGLGERIHRNPEKFREACTAMGGRPVRMGDIGYAVPVFPDMDMCLKFYFADEEFPPQLTFLWDRNVLQFVRYETVYYIAACLTKRLAALMKE